LLNGKTSISGFLHQKKRLNFSFFQGYKRTYKDGKFQNHGQRAEKGHAAEARQGMKIYANQNMRVFIQRRKRGN